MMETRLKDSGIPWIGLIPEHWEVVRIKNIYAERTELSSTGEETLLSVSEYYGIAPTEEKTENDFITRADSLVGYKKCFKGDFVSNIMLAWKGSYGTTEQDGIVSPAYCVYKPIDEVSPKYYHYLFRTELFKCVFKQYSKGVIDSRLRLYSPYFMAINTIVPPLAEQDRIAAWLDTKCGEIDELIDVEQQMISDLEAYRQAVITEAVTHGLNPNAPTKSTSIPWLHSIPKYWGECRLKFLAKISTGDKDTIMSVEDGKYPFFVRSPKVERINSFSYDGEAILMAGDGVGAGRVFHHYIGKFDWHQRVYNMHDLSAQIKGRFLYYYLLSNFHKLIDAGSAKSTVDSVRLPMLTNFSIPLPPLSEQREIADYLDAKCAEIDELIKVKQEKIESLKQYRRSLIFEAVTGKTVIQ